MKRLFQVHGFNFESKQAAKGFRDDLNNTGHALYDGTKVEAGSQPAVVSKGPDHIGNHGLPVMSTRHRAPQVLKPKREEPRVRKNAKK